MVHAIVTGHPVDPNTSRWLVSIDVKLADRLAAVELIEKRDASTLVALHCHAYRREARHSDA
jgi:hypothetical protein